MRSRSSISDWCVIVWFAVSLSIEWSFHLCLAAPPSPLHLSRSAHHLHHPSKSPTHSSHRSLSGLGVPADGALCAGVCPVFGWSTTPKPARLWLGHPRLRRPLPADLSCESVPRTGHTQHSNEGGAALTSSLVLCLSAQLYVASLTASQPHRSLRWPSHPHDHATPHAGLHHVPCHRSSTTGTDGGGSG